MACYSHKNIVRIREAFRASSGNRRFGVVVMQRLKKLYDKFPVGSLDRLQFNKIIQEVAEGISFLHANNVTHRDIKPDNILICEAGGRWNAVVTDFDVCAFQTAGNQTLIGTQGFMAPEIFFGTYDRRCDIFSFAATIKEWMDKNTIVGMLLS